MRQQQNESAQLARSQQSIGIPILNLPELHIHDSLDPAQIPLRLESVTYNWNSVTFQYVCRQPSTPGFPPKWMEIGFKRIEFQLTAKPLSTDCQIPFNRKMFCCIHRPFRPFSFPHGRIWCYVHLQQRAAIPMDSNSVMITHLLVLLRDWYHTHHRVKGQVGGGSILAWIATQNLLI